MSWFRKNAHPNEMRLYTHSALVYWWPVWLFGLILGFVTQIWGEPLELAAGEYFKVLPTSGPGLAFASLTLLTSYITTVRLQGVRSIMLVMSLAILALFLAWIGALDDVFNLLPGLRTHLSAGFYFTFSGGLLILWLAYFLIFDRLSYWRISEGQLTHVELAGLSEKSYDARGLTVEHEADDLFRHILFGFGSGDLIVRTSGGDAETFSLRNLLSVGRKVDRIQALIAIEPTQMHP